MLHARLLYLDSIVSISLSLLLFLSPSFLLTHLYPGSPLPPPLLTQALSLVYFNLAMIAYYSTSMPADQSIKPARCTLIYHTLYTYIIYSNTNHTLLYCYAAVAYHAIMAAAYSLAMATHKSNVQRKKQ